MTLQTSVLSQQHQNWKERQQRLFGIKPRQKVEAKPVSAADPTIEIAKPKSRPMWSWTEMYFDWHVRAWQEMTHGASVAELAHQNAAMRAALRVAEIDDALVTTVRRPIKDIVSEVLEAFPGIEWRDIQSGHRTKEVIYPRHLCMHAVCTQRPDLSYPRIGRHFGGRDHTTILHGVKKIEKMTEDDHRRELSLQRKYCKKRRRHVRDRIREIEAQELVTLPRIPTIDGYAS